MNEDNSYFFVIVFIAILVGSLFIGILNIMNAEIINIIYNEANITYEAIIYKNNRIEITKQDCSGELCFIETSAHKGSEVEQFVNYIKNYENEYINYDPFKNSSYIIYINKKDMALYDDTIDDSLLRTKLKQLLEN